MTEKICTWREAHGQRSLHYDVIWAPGENTICKTFQTLDSFMDFTYLPLSLAKRSCIFRDSAHFEVLYLYTSVSTFGKMPMHFMWFCFKFVFLCVVLDIWTFLVINVFIKRLWACFWLLQSKSIASNIAHQSQAKTLKLENSWICQKKIKFD